MSDRRLIGFGRSFGTCGELLQGVLPEGDIDFLVTMPVCAGSTALFECDSLLSGVKVHPANKIKSQRLAELILRRLCFPGGGRLYLSCELPEGKGMASSSADLVATARAVGDAIGREFLAAEIERFLKQIEPSDGVMYPGIVAFRHRQVRLHSWLGAPPRLTIVAADEGGEVDTVAFNRIPKPFTAADKREYAGLLRLLAEALAVKDLRTVGWVTTRSAEMNSVLRPRIHLDAVISDSRSIGALGVVVAHSGTTIGLLLAEDDPDYRRKLAAATAWAHCLGALPTIHRSWRPEFRTSL